MPALDRKIKITCGNRGSSVTKKHLSRHTSSCSGGTLYCPKCPNFFTKARVALNFHIAKKHSAAGPKTSHTYKECSIEFPSFYSLRHDKERYHTAETTSSGGKAEKQSLADAGDDKSLEEELQSCRHFLVDCGIRKGRHSVFNLVVNKLTAQVIEEKLDRILDKLKCAARLNLALGFILKNIKDGNFRYFYAHENNTLLEQSKLVSNRDDIAKLKESLKKTDVIESCTKERSNTKWRFFKLTNLTFFAALLRDIPMGCKDAVLPESLLKKHTINCLTFEKNTRKPYNDNLCLLRALARHLHGNKRVEEETSKLFSFFRINSTNPDPLMFQGVGMDDIASVQDIVNKNLFIYDIDLIDGAMVGELAQRSIEKHEKSSMNRS